MRPINLIPDEERRSGAVARTGPVVYLLVGTLGVILIGVVMLVLIGNSIHDREAEVARLETEKTAAVAQASKLAPYISFQQVSEDRIATVSELADARFDWVRVIRQLSLVLPGDVYFENLGASGGGGGESGITGPSLKINGCADGQAAVAGFVASLKEIDGVTRVELNKSVVGESTGEAGKGADNSGACGRPGVARFEAVVAFDAAPPSPDSAGSTVGEAAAPESSESEGSEGESSEGESSESSEESSGSEGESESESTQSASAATGGATG
jgi:Tfp pilus assembly protein PilN